MINDIKNHRLFKNLDWSSLLAKKISAPYLPKVKNNHDISNFTSYPDSDRQAVAVKKTDDPFLDWFK